MNDDRSGRIHHLRPLTDAPPPPSAFRKSSRARLADVSTDRLSEANGSAPYRTTTAAVTNAIVRLLRERTGRGPTKGQTALSSSLAVVTLGDYLTRGEETLAAEGHSELVAEGRRALHQGMRADAVAAVEAITGRPVIAYLTDEHRDPDVAVIVFVFGPVARSAQ